MIKRRVSLCHLRAECVEEYRKLHDTIWPELLDTYRSVGIRSISCFLNGNQLIVYSEVDSLVDTADRVRTDVEVRWSALMEPMADPAFPTLNFEEVFHMPTSEPPDSPNQETVF